MPRVREDEKARCEEMTGTARGRFSENEGTAVNETLKV